MDGLRTLIGPDDAALPWQICVRAFIVFAFGILCIRLAGRRTFSHASPLDIVVAIIVGSNLSRIMTGKADFLGGLGASLIIVLLHRLLAMLTLRWGWLARLVKSSPATLVKDGRVDRRALAHHGISEGDLLEALRLENTERAEDIRLATLEPSGNISVVRERP